MAEHLDKKKDKAEEGPKERIGVYVCHCGTNIAGSVDCSNVAEYARGLMSAP